MKLRECDKPDVEYIALRTLNNLSESTGVQFNADQKMMFLCGFGAGLTTFKNFPEYRQSWIYDLWLRFQLSDKFNSEMKEWITNLQN